MPSSSRKLIICVSLAAVAAGAVLARLPFLGYHYDDAMITFRYADNLAQGRGFVFNPGERILGTSTPVFTLTLAGLSLLGVPIPAAANCANVVFQVCICILAFLILSRDNGWITGLAGAALLATSPHLVESCGSGMETPLYTMLLLASFYMYESGYSRPCWIFCGLLALARPEGFLLPLILIGDSAARGRRGEGMRGITLFVVLLAAWALFGALYFGSPLPVSVSAKISMYTRAPTPLAEKLTKFFMFDRPSCELWALPFFLFGLFSMARKKSGALTLAIWLLVYSAAILCARTYIFLWYYTPAITVYLLIATLGASEAVQRLWDLSRGSRLIRLLTAAALLLLVASSGRGLARALGNRHHGMVAHYTRYFKPCLLAAEWVRDTTAPSDLVCAGDIGYLGFVSGRPVLDYVGLVSPEAIGYQRRRDRLGLLKKHLPPYVCGGEYGIARRIFGTPWFKAHYELAHEIGSGGGIRWCIFKRRAHSMI